MPPVYAPTCSNVGIRTAADAFVLLEAVRTGVFPLRRHRLSQAERDNLAPGQVFVWTESSEANGLERWTDGRKWSASRTRDVFLIYEEREEPSVDESVEKAAQRINSYFSNPPSGDLFGIFAFPRDRPPKLGGLMKQTFSAWVYDPTSGHRVKWHLSAYLSRRGPADLPAIADDPVLSQIKVCSGIYECCTGPRKNRKGSRAGGAAPSADQLISLQTTPSPYGSPRQSRRSSRARAEDLVTQIDDSGSPLIYLNEDDWDDHEPSPVSTLSISSSSSSFNTSTPPRTISSSSIGSVGPARSDRRLPRILEPYHTLTPTGSYPPSPTISVSSNFSQPLSPITPSISTDMYHSPGHGYFHSLKHTQEPDPYHHVAVQRASSQPYSLRSEADSKTLAAFRPF